MVPAAMPSTNTHGIAADIRLRHGVARWMREGDMVLHLDGARRRRKFNCKRPGKIGRRA
jgi:hypothetical protein